MRQHFYRQAEKLEVEKQPHLFSTPPSKGWTVKNIKNLEITLQVENIKFHSAISNLDVWDKN